MGIIIGCGLWPVVVDTKEFSTCTQVTTPTHSRSSSSAGTTIITKRPPETSSTSRNTDMEALCFSVIADSRGEGRKRVRGEEGAATIFWRCVMSGGLTCPTVPICPLSRCCSPACLLLLDLPLCQSARSVTVLFVRPPSDKSKFASQGLFMRRLSCVFDASFFHIMPMCVLKSFCQPQRVTVTRGSSVCQSISVTSKPNSPDQTP